MKPEKYNVFLCSTFVMWMLCTSVYSWLILGWKHQTLLSLTENRLLADTPDAKLLQRERGGVRRIGGNGRRLMAKVTLEKSL